MKIIPREDRVLVKMLDAEEFFSQSASGIYLPPSIDDKLCYGEIVATGPGVLLESGERSDLGLKPGANVVFGGTAGTDIDKANNLVLLDNHEVLAVIEK